MSVSVMPALFEKKLNHKYTYICAFLLPLLLMAAIFTKIGITPFGGRTILGAELMDTYYPFLSEFRNKLRDGESLFYSWRISGGTNFWAVIGYYLASPLNLPMLVIPERFLPEMFSLLVMVRLALASLFMSFWISAQFPKIRVGAVLAISVAYAFSGIMIAQLRMFMWLDAIILLPLVALGIWKIICRKHATLFVLAISISLAGSFYTGFYNIFAILFLTPLFYLFARKISPRENAMRLFIRISLYTFLSIGLAAIIILPTGYAMDQTIAAKDSITFWSDFKTDFLFFDFMSRFIYKTPPEFIEHLPNVYCSVLIPLLLPLFWGNSLIRFSEKMTSTCVVILMFVFMTGRPSDYLMNGLHFTQSAHYRYAYLVVFLLMFMALRLFESFEAIRPSHFVIAAIGVIVYLIFYKQVNSEISNDEVIYATIALVLGYIILMYIARKVPRLESVALALILAVVVLELFSSTVFSLKDIGNRDAFINRTTVENTVIAPAMPAEESYDLLSHHVFDLDSSYSNPGALYRLNSVQGTHVLTPEVQLRLMDKLGINILGSNQVTHQGWSNPLSELFGVRYRVEVQNRDRSGTEIQEFFVASSINIMKEIDSDATPSSWTRTEIGTGKMYALAIPDESSVITDTNLSGPAFVNAFAEQIGLPGAYLEVRTDFLRAYNASYVAEDNSYNVTASGRTEIEFRPEIMDSQQIVYVYANAESYDVSVSITNLEDQLISQRTLAHKASGIVRCGSLDNPEETRMRVSIVIEDAEPGTLDVQCVKELPAFLEALQLRNTTHGSQNTIINGREISIRFDPSIAGTVVVFIPYDAGWRIISEGETVRTQSAYGGLLAFELTQDMECVNLKYTPPFFRDGALISMVSLLLFLLLLLFDPWVIRKTAKKSKIVAKPSESGSICEFDIDTTIHPKQSERSDHVNIGNEQHGE